jgi:hypothetical protein
MPPSSSILPRILLGGGRVFRGEDRLPPRPEEYVGGGASDSWYARAEVESFSLLESDEEEDDDDEEGEGVGFTTPFADPF